MSMVRRLSAECAGTFWLVFAGCGSAVLAAGFPDVGIGLLGVSLAFGFALLTAAYAIGPISGCHINPAVTLGLFVAGRFPARDVLPYMAAQVVGAVLASALLLMIAAGLPDFNLATYSGAANGYEQASPSGASLPSGFLTELVLTATFLVVIVGVTGRVAPPGVAPVAIGLTLALIHLISIPITNTSVNPARSTGPALVVGGVAMAQLWLFWVAPMLGGTIGGVLGRLLFAEVEADAARAAQLPPSKAVPYA